jgi:WD40 repeat protein
MGCPHRRRARHPRGPYRRVFSAAFNADASRVVTTSFDNTVRVWDATRGGLLAVLSGHARAVNGAVFSAEGSRIVTLRKMRLHAYGMQRRVLSSLRSQDIVAQ